MLHKTIILVLIVIITSNKVHGAATGTITEKVPTKLSIFNEINNDSEICDTPKIAVLQSNHVSKCKEVFSSSVNNATVSNNADAFLCLGLYDRVYQMCHSRSLDLELPIFRDKAAFESLMSEELKNSTTLLLVCLSFETHLRASLYDKTKVFVDKLSEVLKNPVECPRICGNEKTRFINPLCLIMQVIDRTIHKESLEKETVKPVNSEEPIKNKVKEGSKEASDAKVEGPEIKTSVQSQSLNPQTSTPQLTGETKNTEKKKDEPVIDATVKKDTKKNESKPITPEVNVKNSVIEKENSSPQQPSPPLSQDQITEKLDTPIKEAAEPIDGASVGQIKTPEKNPPEEKSSTVSENTGNGDFDPGMEQNYDSGFRDPDGVPPEMDPDDDINSSPLEKVNSIKEKVADSFQEANNVPKPPRLPDDDDSHFFGYFTIFLFLGFSLFLAYHHKHKIFAMLLEGRRSRGGRARRRPSTANYRKLDCTLEEAVTSQCSSNVTHVIY